MRGVAAKLQTLTALYGSLTKNAHTPPIPEPYSFPSRHPMRSAGKPCATMMRATRYLVVILLGLCPGRSVAAEVSGKIILQKKPAREVFAPAAYNLRAGAVQIGPV